MHNRIASVAVLLMLPGLVLAAALPGVSAQGGVTTDVAAATSSLLLPMVASDGLPGDSNNPDPYPIGTRTGVADVDGVLVALEEDTPESLKALFEDTPAPCVVNPQGVTNPPLCPEGVPAGTLVPVFRATSCEAVWPDYLDQLLQDVLWSGPSPVLAIYRDPTDAYAWLPAADYAIVVLGQSDPNSDGRPVVIRVSNGKVNGIDFGCGDTFDSLVDGVTEDRFLLPPQR